MSNEQKRKPTHRIYVVTSDSEKGSWTEIGAAWPHQDGKGFSIRSAILNADIVMREITAQPKKAAE